MSEMYSKEGNEEYRRLARVGEFFDPQFVRYDLAAGMRKREHFKTVDISKKSKPDIVCNLEKTPWPIKSGTVDFVNCSQYLEHCQNQMGFMNELHRILKPEGVAILDVPYYTSIYAWQDPTHVRPISENTFLYYNKEWREREKLTHYPITADFEARFHFAWSKDIEKQNLDEATKTFARLHYFNAVDFMVVMLKKRGK